MSVNKKERKTINERIEFAAANDITKVFEELNSGFEGLLPELVEDIREEYGENKITEGKKVSIFRRLLNSFVNPFTLILIGLALVSFVTEVYIPIKNGTSEAVDIVTIVIIMTMVIVSGFLSFIQEYRSGNAAEKLLGLITTTTAVERVDQGKQELPLEEVVVGDIIHLAAGDMIPADLRIIEAKDLFISQSALTGESDTLEKKPNIQKFAEGETGSFLEYQNLAFMGTNVLSGYARAIVVVTGDDTVFGQMAKAITKEPEETSFDKGVNSVSWLLLRLMFIMVPIVFFLNGITKRDWMSAFLFAISVAVGLTPEMLPMIVTTSLAKGAVAMSKKKTIIKNLNSIQNLGAMDLLCTDKTGTITQDKVILEYPMDVLGNIDIRVLRHAFINSYFQTGLKNLIDIAIIDRTYEEAEKHKYLNNLADSYDKVDEIPFDFERRRMSVVVADEDGKTQMITKGAVEEMLSICSYVEYEGSVVLLTRELERTILRTVENYNDDGMRVIAVAQRTNPPPEDSFSVKDENAMVLIGYLAFLDPPKESTEAAIKALLDHGVTTKVITGDNDRVAKSICKQVGLEVENILLGPEIDEMDDEKLSKRIEGTSVFAKIAPEQKARIVNLFRQNGHTVGFMGDGINDAAAMKAADIGISVDTAVDIAKESANIILLEKDLMVLEEGIIEGRKTYANMIKYIKMTASSNFGNVFSILIASAFLPFLPMVSIHLIFLNLIYDLSCIAIPWDNVDPSYLKQPKQWDSSSIGTFMLWFGPTSSVFDITTYLLMYFVVCPLVVSNGVLFSAIPETEVAMRQAYIALFQAGWFVESMWSQTLVIHLIRTAKIPFIQSNASFPVYVLTLLGVAIVTAIPFTSFGTMLGFYPLPPIYFLILAVTIFLYMLLVAFTKNRYIKKYNDFL